MERRGRAVAFILLLLLLLLLSPAQAQPRHPLPVLWMMPVSSGSGRDNLTAAVLPAVRLALRDLQRQPAPLGNYELQLQLLDSQCDAAKSLKALFDALWAGPEFLLLFGGVCPSVTTLIARSLPSLNLVQVSFAASSPSLSNRKWYGNLFSTVPSDRALNHATVKLLQRHRWSRVGVVTQEGPRLSEMKKDLLRQLLKADVQVVSSESLSADVCSSLRRLKEIGVRIIIGQIEEDSLSEVFCCAYRLRMFGPRYQWLVVGGAGVDGWRLGWQLSGCPVQDLLAAADGSIRLQTRRLSNTNTAGISGRTPQDYLDSYLGELTKEESKVSLLHAFAYDAVWVAANALSQVMEAQRNRERYGVGRNISAGPEESHRMLLEAVKRTSFEGVTGPVFFRNGERVASIELIQLQGSRGVSVGEFSSSTQQLRLISHLLKFKGPGPPRDRTMVLEQWQHVGLVLYGVVSSAAAVTIVITLTVLCFIVCSQKLRLLRWNGGSRDDLLLLGILLSSSSILVSGLDEALLSDQTYEILCSVRLWTLCVGHTVGFAVLFTKAWRIYSLCCVKHTPRPRQTGFLVFWLFLLDVFVLVTWQVLDPLRRVVLQQNIQTNSSRDQDVELLLSSEFCSCTNMELWLTAIYGYKGPLLGLGCFVAWSIRSVQVDHPAVSSRQLTLSMLSLTVFSASGVSGALLTSHNPPVQFCVVSSLVLCCSVFILVCMFGPKFVYVCVHGNKLLQPLNLQAAEDEEEEQLRRMNTQLKSHGKQLDLEIETITMQLYEESETADSDLKRGRHNAGEARSVVSALICSEDTNMNGNPLSPDHINSPEQVRRRLSIQLPILHHSYLPVIGGVSASSSSLFGSREAFVHHDLLIAAS